MTPEQKAAYISAQAACAQCEVLAMQTANHIEEAANRKLLYTPGDFLTIIEKYGIHHNAVCMLFQE